jgi:hypothetical protein
MSKQFTRNRCSAFRLPLLPTKARRGTHSGTQIDFLWCSVVLYCAIRVAVSSCKRLTIHRFHGDNTGSNPVGDANYINNLETICAPRPWAQKVHTKGARFCDLVLVHK